MINYSYLSPAQPSWTIIVLPNDSAPSASRYISERSGRQGDVGRHCLWEEGWTLRRFSRREMIRSFHSRLGSMREIILSSLCVSSCFFCFLLAFKIIPKPTAIRAAHVRFRREASRTGWVPGPAHRGKVTGCLIGTNQATGRAQRLSRSEEKRHWPTEIGTAVGCVHITARLHIRSTCLISLVNNKKEREREREREREKRCSEKSHAWQISHRTLKRSRVLRIMLHYSFLFFHSELLLWITEESLLRIRRNWIKNSSERVRDGLRRMYFCAGTNICESSISLSNY